MIGAAENDRHRLFNTILRIIYGMRRSRVLENA